MVKAEFDRDYYADLELQPTATANDIKKQFKKLALQYHPDRNPSTDTTAKFQAIQSANEVLTDPQQRAKYDAQRIRTGQLHTHTEAPPPPPRRQPPGFSNFPPPPPPPPPPMTTKKSTFSSSSSTSGPQKYARFSTPDPPPWRTRTTDDARAKTNDFKAWEHMRHGQGPIPRGRKETKHASSFPLDRESQDQTRDNATSTTPKRSGHRRNEWENLADAGMPDTQRNSSARVPPKTPTFAPSTPGVGDDTQARSAYFKMSADRPPPSRVQSSMPPPPPPRPPTAKRPEPSHAFKSQNGVNDLPVNGQRSQRQYPSARVEKPNIIPAPGLHRSATTAARRDNKSQTGFRETDSLRAKGNHVRSASASSPFRKSGPPSMASASTSSSDSSSDDDDDDEEEEEESAARKREAANFSKTAFNRPNQESKTTRPSIGTKTPQRSFFNPHVTVDEARDEPMVSDAGYNGGRRHSGIELPTHKRYDDPPEGFMEHRKKHETAQSRQQGSSKLNGPEPPHFVQRHKSFDEQYRRSTQRTEDERPNNANKPSTPMYDSGFRWGAGDLPKPSVGAPLRSQSTENIDMKFSPSVNPPKFGENSVFSSTQESGETSSNPIEISDGEGSPKKTNGVGGSSPARTPIGPPPKGPACFFPNDWHQRAWAGSFQAEPSRSQSRPSSQRRTGTSRASSSNNIKRNGQQQKAAGLQPTVNDAADEPPIYTTTTSDNPSSSRVSSDGSAMDIDPILTPPPSGNDNHQRESGDDVSPTRQSETNNLPNQASQLPPRVAVPVQPETDSLKFGVNDFKNVKPFNLNGNGLEGVSDDLSQALPFESRASPTRPISEDNAAAAAASQGLKLPKPPKAPSPPNPLNPTTWHSYVNAMTAYMSNWTNFNNTMLSHFHIRQETVQKQLSSGWISVQGDADYNAYISALKEDEKARKWWEVACEKHMECMTALGEVRVAMKAEMARAKNFPYPS